MQYLVCRMDALKPHGHMRTSEHFPMVVEWPDGTPGTKVDIEYIVRKALDSNGYIGTHEYFVVPMFNAQIVSFKPPRQPQYEVDVRPYWLS